MKPFFSALAIAALWTTTVSAGSVDVRLSSHEAYVGSPLTMQIMISNATDFDQPILPSIDGCDIRSLGAPSQSSQITIINGRRSESRSVIMQYQITPRREGAFTLPALTINVDGKTVMTQPQHFVATKSETGDLMFVEIGGGKEKVFVGQPLDLELQIWLKPFRDPNTGQTLSEGDMWSMISDSSTWGGFTAKMIELAERNRRPGGREVIRDAGDGTERAYYHYTIKATVYPKRAGKIDASDVQIVVDYPTAIGKSRSSHGSLFGDDRMFGHSMLSQMMNDDFFGSSFGNRLVVTNSRPIVGEISVDATEVLPVPTMGRPADYRGAVGRYRIMSQATPTIVDAGDPITLNIGIVGTGPMELVQAPPLSELPELTAAFKVADEALAGFVQGETKVFSTTIRPRREGITEIPGIRFSFFDPETEQFQTVISEPIEITVNRSKMLTLDAIVGSAADASTTGRAMDPSQPDFTNHRDAAVLVSQAPRPTWNWLPLFLIAPPLIWVVIAIAKHRLLILGVLPSFRSAKARCLASIKVTREADDVRGALVTYLNRRFPTRNPSQTLDGFSDTAHTLSNKVTKAIGQMRIAGMYELANEVESFLAAGRKPFDIDLETSAESDELCRSVISLVERIDEVLSAKQRTYVRLQKTGRTKREMLTKTAAMMVATTLIGWTNVVSAADVLSQTRRATILAEADEAYWQASEKSKIDSADAKELFSIAMSKYQLLADSGVCNANLFVNLGNAAMQSGKLGDAIANYEKALRLEPNNSQAKQNLAFADKKTSGSASALPPGVGSSWVIPQGFVSAGKWMLGIASVIFWGLLIMRLVFRPFFVWKFAAAPLLILLIFGGALWSSPFQSLPPFNAVIVSDNVSLHLGDGEQFDTVTTIDKAAGHRVMQLAERGDWTHIRTFDGHTGWVHNRNIVFVAH